MSKRRGSFAAIEMNRPSYLRERDASTSLTKNNTILAEYQTYEPLLYTYSTVEALLTRFDLLNRRCFSKPSKNYTTVCKKEWPSVQY
jgi:hypothetical protein